jgi:hypothetical protein
MRFEQVYDWAMSVGAIAVQREEAQSDLWARTAAVAGRLNRAHAELVDIAVELVEGGHWGDGGFRSPEHYFTVRAGLSPAHARDVVVIARRRAELPDTAAALGAGELSLDAAAVVAHHAPASYQASMTHLARHATVPQLRRAASRHGFHDPGADVVTAHPDPVSDAAPSDTPASDGVGIGVGVADESERRACARPELTMHYDRDGRFQLRYSAPATIGALVEQAVKEAKDALFLRQRRDERVHPEDGSEDDVTPGGLALADAPPDAAGRPSYADALAEIAHRSLAGVVPTSRASHYRVYLHLDTSGAWVNNGGAIPTRLLRGFLSDGVLQPIWETDGRPISVGRAMRILPARSRRLIEDRDRGCRFPGCTATRFVEIHHLEEWAAGGATDDDNQVSLCPFHHDAIDRGDFTITGDPTRPDGLVVVNRFGHRLGPPTPGELAIGAGGTWAGGTRADDDVGDHPAYQPPTGERARWRDIELPSDRELQPTFTTRLRLVEAQATASGAAPTEVVERDPFDAIRRWDDPDR